VVAAPITLFTLTESTIAHHDAKELRCNNRPPCLHPCTTFESTSLQIATRLNTTGSPGKPDHQLNVRFAFHNFGMPYLAAGTASGSQFGKC
jgi:hypothetical protein